MSILLLFRYYYLKRDTLVPKVQVDYTFDLKPNIRRFNDFTKSCQEIEAAIPCERIGVAVIGLEVPHAHVHLIPLVGISDIDLSTKT